MISPTPRQADLLRYVHGYQQVYGRLPCFRVMAADLNMASKSGAHRLMEQLVDRGALRIVADPIHPSQRTAVFLTEPALPKAPDGAPLFFVPVKERAE